MRQQFNKHEHFSYWAIFQLISEHVPYTAPYSKYTYTIAQYEMKQDPESWKRSHRCSATLRMRKSVDFNSAWFQVVTSLTKQVFYVLRCSIGVASSQWGK
jgi:hypothetical protein